VNLTVALGLAGATPADVVRTTVYVVTSARSDLGVVWDAVQASPYAPAASTLLGVGLLGYEGQLVEIEATAVAGGPISPDSRAGHHGAGPAPLPSSRRPPTPR
jgi:enamine deaminase RidA (YjgF/YER057c/UK114 family)